MTSCRTLGDGGSCRGREAKIHEGRWASIAVQAAADVLRPCTVHRPIYFLPSTRPSTSTTTSSWRVKAHWLVASCTNANIVWFPCIYLLASISLESCLLAIAWVLYVIIFLRWACWFDLVNWKFRTSGFDFVFTWSSQKRMILQIFFWEVLQLLLTHMCTQISDRVITHLPMVSGAQWGGGWILPRYATRGPGKDWSSGLEGAPRCHPITNDPFFNCSGVRGRGCFMYLMEHLYFQI